MFFYASVISRRLFGRYKAIRFSLRFGGIDPNLNFVAAGNLVEVDFSLRSGEHEEETWDDKQ